MERRQDRQKIERKEKVVGYKSFWVEIEKFRDMCSVERGEKSFDDSVW